MKQINKLLLCFLLIAAILPAITAVYFIAGSIISEHIAFERMEKGAARTFVVPATSVQWLKEGKELTIDGKLFDVSRYREKGDSLELTGLFDREEDILIEQYKNIVQDKKQGGKQQAILLKIFFTPALTFTQNSFVPHRYATGKLLFHTFGEAAINMPAVVTGKPPQPILSA